MFTECITMRQPIIGFFGKLPRSWISSHKFDSVFAYLILCHTFCLLLKILAKIWIFSLSLSFMLLATIILLQSNIGLGKALASISQAEVRINHISQNCVFIQQHLPDRGLKKGLALLHKTTALKRSCIFHAILHSFPNISGHLF